MKLISTEEAVSRVDGFTDRINKPVDPGIAQALAQFVRFAEALSFDTVQSCEGHIDWGCPYPWIKFRIPHISVYIPPLWKIWKLRQRISARRVDNRHFQNEEDRADMLCALVSRILIDFQKCSEVSDPICVLRVNRDGPCTFTVMPAHDCYFVSCKYSGDFETLNRTLAIQRRTMLEFGQYCVAWLSKESNFDGIPEHGCPGCLGRG